MIPDTIVVSQFTPALTILLIINLLLVGLAWYNLKEIRRLIRGFMASDKIYVKKESPVGVYTWYQLDGIAAPILLGGEPAGHYPNPSQRYLIDYTGYNYNVSLVVCDGIGGKVVPVWYKSPASAEWVETSTSILDIAAYGLGPFGPDLDSNLFGFSILTLTENVNTNEKTFHFQPPGYMSPYSVGRDLQRRLIYMGGYSQQSHKWDVDTDTVSRIVLAKQYDDPVAPYGDAKYYYQIDKSSDDNIWWGCNWIRGTPEHGAQAVWYNPDDGTTGDVGWGFIDIYDAQNFAMNLSGTKYVISLKSLLSIINTRKKTVKYIANTNLGIQTLGRIVSVERSKATVNQFVGITPVKYVAVTVTGGTKPVAGEVMTGVTSGHTAKVWVTPTAWTGTFTMYFWNNSGSFGPGAENVTFAGTGTGTIPNYLETKCAVYGVNIRTGILSWGPVIKDYIVEPAGVPNCFSPIFAHELVWFYAYKDGNNLIVGMNPDSGTIEQSQIVTNPGRMCWFGDVLWHSDATTNSVYQITGLV